MAEVIVRTSEPVAPVVQDVTLVLSLEEALYVAGVLGQSSQHHPLMERLVSPDAKTVWDTLIDALDAKGINRHQNRIYQLADDMVVPAFQNR